jgi:molecular chaperone GrpE
MSHCEKEQQNSKADQQSYADEQLMCSKISELESALIEANDQRIRALAEVENIHKRAQREKEDAANFGATVLARGVVSFVDNLERALKNVPDVDPKSEIASFVEGVRMTARDVIGMLEKHGIVKIDSDGQPFNPDLHQAVSEVDSDCHANGTVAETLQTGYTINGRLLRAAAVAVAKRYV